MLRGEPAAFVDAHQRTSAPPLALSFAIARAAKQAGNIALSERLLKRVASRATGSLAQRAIAHLAHVDYYRGDFARGVERASISPSGPLPRAEAHLYRSVNLVALNDPRHAADAARAARRLCDRLPAGPIRTDLRFRCARQLVHVLVSRGHYIEALAEADAAAAAARALGDHRRLGYAAYLRGFTRAARGHAEATADYAEAERQWAGSYVGLHRWLRVLWAALLRDLGEIGSAELILPKEGAIPSWEVAMFDLARGDKPRVPAVDSAPDDERPFLLASRGLVALEARDLGRAEADLSEAVVTFDRGGLEHYRRGAALALALVHASADRRAIAMGLLRRERDAIVAMDIRRWPWWDQALVLDHRELFESAGFGGDVLQNIVGAGRDPVSDDALLSARGLTQRERAVVRTWMQNPHYTRRKLAATLGIREASVRAHLTAIRQKLELSVRGARGLRTSVEALRASPRHGLL